MELHEKYNEITVSKFKVQYQLRDFYIMTLLLSLKLQWQYEETLETAILGHCEKLYFGQWIIIAV